MVFALCLGSAAPALAGFADVPTNHWAYDAVNYVAVDHNWIQGYSDGFRPDRGLTRMRFARAMVLAFAPDEQPDPAITFTDVTGGSQYRYAAIAVKHKWLSTTGGAFLPTDSFSKAVLDRALLFALGLKSLTTQLGKITTTDGYVFPHAWGMRYAILASELHLNHDYPSSSEKYELLPTSNVSRAFAAYAIWKAATVSQWQLDSLQAYGSIVLPQMNTAEKKAVDFAFRWAGYPYVYAGEWYKPTGSGYCCGTQLQGGFDCSGFAWWVLKAPSGTWNNTSIRGYTGWSLPQRTSYDMARYTSTKISFSKLQPMDLLFWDTDGQGTGWLASDHVGMYLGSGWMIHSSGSRGGISIDFIGDGSWWRSRFLWGRRLLPTYVPPPPPPPPPDPTPTPTVSPSASPTVSPSP